MVVAMLWSIVRYRIPWLQARHLESQRETRYAMALPPKQQCSYCSTEHRELVISPIG
jgi:hypothetical protein